MLRCGSTLRITQCGLGLGPGGKLPPGAQRFDSYFRDAGCDTLGRGRESHVAVGLGEPPGLVFQDLQVLIIRAESSDVCVREEMRLVSDFAGEPERGPLLRLNDGRIGGAVIQPAEKRRVVAEAKVAPGEKSLGGPTIGGTREGGDDNIGRRGCRRGIRGARYRTRDARAGAGAFRGIPPGIFSALKSTSPAILSDRHLHASASRV